MEIPNVLDLLALEAGIQPGFHDRKGAFHQVSTQTLKALLEAMHLLPGGADPESALADLRSLNQWELLPRVLVQNSRETSHTIPLALKQNELDKKIRYYLAADQGESHSGEIGADDLQPETEADTRDSIQTYTFTLPVALPPGHHRLTVHTEGREASLKLIVSPPSCYLPAGMQQGHRLWGTSLQLSSLSSRRNWGIGDFSDLEHFIDICADTGIDAVGLTPLHRATPFENTSTPLPTSRYYIDPLLVDLSRVSDYSAERFQHPDFADQLLACRKSDNIDYRLLNRLKYEGFRILYRDFCTYHLDTRSERADDFQIFKAAGGKRLFHHALFFALQEHFAGKDHGEDWRHWPSEYRSPYTKEVKEFAQNNATAVDLFCYIFRQSELQFAACGDHSLARHLGVGLCPEIALGAAPYGAETWVQNNLYSRTATIGLPPDEHYAHGLDWGLAPPIPWALARSDYEPFISLLRTTMRYAGAIQIDHASQMMRLFWIPEGAEADEGAYVVYPLQDLLGIVTLESRRNRCMVLARERGMAEQDFSQVLRERNIFPVSFFLAGDNEAAETPANWPPQTTAMVSPPGPVTLTGYWEGLDLAKFRRESPAVTQEGILEADTLRQMVKKRALTVLEEEDLLPPGTILSPEAGPEMTDALIRAVHRYLARTPALLIMTRLEDIYRLRKSRSLFPAGLEMHSRLRFSPCLEEIQASSILADFAAVIANERSSSPIPREHRGRQPIQAIIPRATYRIQLNRYFTFSQAAEIVSYLFQLGISHCYTSPCFAARTGSIHGYDTVDPNALNQEIGGMEDFTKFNHALQEKGMGQVMDIVPNHMGVMGSDNLWWLDVLENGPSSAYAEYFDIDWEPAKAELRHKLLIPVLGEPYGRALEQGSLQLTVSPEEGSFSIFYHGHRFPLDPHTYPVILNRRLDILEIRMGPENPFLIELLSLITAFGQLSPATETDQKKVRIRRRDKEILKDRLATLAEKCPDIRRHLQETADEYNSRTVDDANWSALHALLEEQNFRPAYWRVAADEINYRRFFDINDLAALCVEKQEVFTATHRLIVDLIRQGKVEGLRIDHPDGLFDPAGYYRRLCSELQPEQIEDTGIPIYLVAEKILAHYEHLPPDWPIHGTTGYDFAGMAGNLFVDKRSEKQISRIYRRFTGIADDFDTILYACKKRIMRLGLASELNVLANRLDKLSERNRETRDFTLNNLREALSEVAACFPVYRTYVTEAGHSPQDRNSIDWAISEAKKNSPVSDHTIFDFLRSVLIPEAEPGIGNDFHMKAIDFAMRFQQFTAPVMAKGMEDTAFYIYNRLVSLNEVGSNPSRFGISVAAFHRLCREQAERWPHSLLATSTHDSKHSEDARCRLNVLSEIPDEWNRRLLLWSRTNREHLEMIDGGREPSANDEYLLYQTLLAVWPIANPENPGLQLESLRERVQAYMIKACREAKTSSSWAEPNPDYEEALSSFIDSLLADTSAPFLTDFLDFLSLLTRIGLYNSLSLCFLKLTAPGIPDIYQGCELWDFHLVDPDNRQPIDYARRISMLGDLHQRLAQDERPEITRELFSSIEDSRLKLFVIQQLLVFRRRHEDLFLHSAYIPLTTTGEKAHHVCAFARRLGKKLVIAVCARLFASLTDNGKAIPCGDIWIGTFLEIPAAPGEYWQDLFTGASLSMRDLDGMKVLAMEDIFSTLPIAFLECREKE